MRYPILVRWKSTSLCRLVVAVLGHCRPSIRLMMRCGSNMRSTQPPTRGLGDLSLCHSELDRSIDHFRNISFSPSATSSSLASFAVRSINLWLDGWWWEIDDRFLQTMCPEQKEWPLFAGLFVEYWNSPIDARKWYIKIESNSRMEIDFCLGTLYFSL